MLRVFRSTAAVATLFICANSASIADSNWTITVNNTSKVAVDVSIYCEKKVVGKATAVPSGKSSKIFDPSPRPQLIRINIPGRPKSPANYATCMMFE